MMDCAFMVSIKCLTSPRGNEIFMVFLPSSWWRAGTGMATAQFAPPRPFHTRWAQSTQAGRGCAHKNIKKGQQSPCQSRAVGHIGSQRGGRMPDPLQRQPLVRAEVTAFLRGVNHHQGLSLEGQWLQLRHQGSPFTQQCEESSSGGPG